MKKRWRSGRGNWRTIHIWRRKAVPRTFCGGRNYGRKPTRGIWQNLPAHEQLPERRVVITGMGIISASGLDLKTFWSNVRGGISAAAPITRFDVSRLPVKIAALVKDFDVAEYIKTRKPGLLGRIIRSGVSAATQAVRDAGIDLSGLDSRTG